HTIHLREWSLPAASLRQSGDCRLSRCALQADAGLFASHLMSGKGCICMAETKRTVERPLSPHLGIYRITITMLMSIVHRITGAALYFGTILLAAWLVSAAM